jgi:hypothetical protein
MSDCVPSGYWAEAFIEYRWRCFICGHVAKKQFTMSGRSPIPNPPDLPALWSRIGDVNICDAHKIDVIIDSAKFPHGHTLALNSAT